jgi:hypothetical protein
VLGLVRAQIVWSEAQLPPEIEVEKRVVCSWGHHAQQRPPSSNHWAAETPAMLAMSVHTQRSCKSGFQGAGVRKHTESLWLSLVRKRRFQLSCVLLQGFSRVQTQGFQGFTSQGLRVLGIWSEYKVYGWSLSHCTFAYSKYTCFFSAPPPKYTHKSRHTTQHMQLRWRCRPLVCLLPNLNSKGQTRQ